MAIEETNDIIETDEISDDNTSVNWEAKFTKLKERQRSAKTAYESKIADLEARVKEAPREVKEVKTEFGLLEKAFLKASGYADPDEVEILKKWQKDTNKGIDELVDHPFIKTEIANLRTAKANQLATANLKSDGRTTEKSVDDYLADGTLPENTKERRKVLTEKLRREKDGSKGGKFFSE